MAGYEFEDTNGNRYRITQGAGPGYVHPENIGAGSPMIASELLKNVPFDTLVAANDHFWISVLSKMKDVTLRPGEALSNAIASSYLTIEKIGTAIAADNEVEDPRGMLPVQIQQALTEIIAGERAEAAMYERQMEKESTFSKGLIYTGAFMTGIGTSVWGALKWVKEVSDVVNPVVKIYHQAKAIQAGWESEDFYSTYSATYMQAEKRELVEALGFDPTAISAQQIDEAIAMASMVMDDPMLQHMLYQFVKDYAEAQHAIEITEVAGSGAFELILTIILAAVTGGAGVVAAIGSKAPLIRKFRKVGDLLSDFAKATRKLKIQSKQRKAKGKPADFKDLETSETTAKKGKSGPEGDQSKTPPPPAKKPPPPPKTNPVLDKHNKDVDAHQKAYETKRDNAIANGESNRTVGAYKAKVTEAKGERAASEYMTKNHPDAEMVRGFETGPGFDQVYVKRAADGSIEEYIIVEAKGPGAKLGTKAKKGKQMSKKWVGNTVKSMEKATDSNTADLGSSLKDAIDFGPLPKVSGMGIEAVETNGVVTGVKPISLPDGNSFN